VSRSLTFETGAIDIAARFLADDSAGLQTVMAAIDRLIHQPAPAGSSSFGPDLRRLRIGRYRVLYRVGDDEISVIHLGRTAA